MSAMSIEEIESLMSSVKNSVEDFSSLNEVVNGVPLSKQEKAAESVLSPSITHCRPG
jgi:hypothetical protein